MSKSMEASQTSTSFTMGKNVVPVFPKNARGTELKCHTLPENMASRVTDCIAKTASVVRNPVPLFFQ